MPPTGPHLPRNAIITIHEEHRAIGAVMHGLLHCASIVREQGRLPDIKLLRAMLFYLDVFPERFHHPKEDRYLFAKLRQRTAETDEVLARLEDEHAHGGQQIRELAQASIRLEFDPERYAEVFVSKVEAYAVLQMRHMGLEEDIVLPCAQRELNEADWRHIDAAFGGSVDPLLGIDVKNGFDQLFRRIVASISRPAGEEAQFDLPQSRTV